MLVMTPETYFNAVVGDSGGGISVLKLKILNTHLKQPLLLLSKCMKYMYEDVL